MSRIYLDACSIIYLVEAKSPFHAVVVSRLLQHQTDPASRLLTSAVIVPGVPDTPRQRQRSETACSV